MKKKYFHEDNRGITEDCVMPLQNLNMSFDGRQFKGGWALLGEHRPCAADVSLPDGNGTIYSERLEKEKTPVIFLTARDEENDIVKGLELGAEDYITKPFQ